MRIWKREPVLEALNKVAKRTLAGNLGIEFIEVGEGVLVAQMPVDKRTVQPYGILHGGASAALAEELGSAAGSHCCEKDEAVIGLEINANHIKSASGGVVTGVAKPIHLGKSTQVWEIKVINEQGELVCVSRLTMVVIKTKRKKQG